MIAKFFINPLVSFNYDTHTIHQDIGITAGGDPIPLYHYYVVSRQIDDVENDHREDIIIPLEIVHDIVRYETAEGHFRVHKFSCYSYAGLHDFVSRIETVFAQSVHYHLAKEYRMTRRSRQLSAGELGYLIEDFYLAFRPDGRW